MTCCETSVGIDLVHVPPLRATLTRFGPRFTRRVFTELEIAYCERQHDPARSFAVRFAAKEAAIKAMGLTGTLGVMRAIEVSDPAPRSAPRLRLAEAALSGSGTCLPDALALSLSHDGDYAIGTVVATRCTNSTGRTDRDGR